jgi:hypothetical protein
MRHYGIRSYDHLLPKFHRYARVQAELWFRQGRKPSLAQLLLRPLFRFFQTYVLRWGFLDGMVGVQVCMLTACGVFFKQARLWELHYTRGESDAAPHERQFLVPTEAATRWSKLDRERMHADAA